MTKDEEILKLIEENKKLFKVMVLLHYIVSQNGLELKYPDIMGKSQAIMDSYFKSKDIDVDKL